MTNKRLKIENLQDLNIYELTEEEAASLQGGLVLPEEPKSYYPDYPPSYPDYPPIPNTPINNVPCTNHPIPHSPLPWCAVVL